MRSLLIAASLLTLAACSKAPDGNAEPDFAGNAAAGVAFTYAYDFELPSRSISDLQEAHAQACERLGAGRCRITGLRYTVDRDGGVAASLSVKVAAPIARSFGRSAVKTAESTGAMLVARKSAARMSPPPPGNRSQNSVPPKPTRNASLSNSRVPNCRPPNAPNYSANKRRKSRKRERRRWRQDDSSNGSPIPRCRSIIGRGMVAAS